MGALKVRVGGAWVTIPGYGNTFGVPTGGVLGDLLIKNGAVDGDTRWGTDPPKLALTSTNTPGLGTGPSSDPLFIGQQNDYNIALYRTGAMARQNGAASIFRLNYFGGQVIVGGGDVTQYPPGLMIGDSAHATSRRSTLQFGSGWQIMQDNNANGTKDFGIYCNAVPRYALRFSADALDAIGGFNRLSFAGQSPGDPASNWIATDGNYLDFHAKTNAYIDGDNVYLRNAAYTEHARVASDGIHLRDSSWFRAYGMGGVYFATYAGGLYMIDTTWVRTYNNKNFYCNQTLRGYATEAEYAFRFATATTGLYLQGSNMDVYAQGSGVFRVQPGVIGMLNSANVIRFYGPDDPNHTLGYSSLTPTGSGEASNGPKLQGYTSVWLYNALNNKSLFLASNGNAFLSAGNSWTTFSSIEFKDDVTDIDPREALATVMAWRPKRFRWKPDQHAAKEYGEGFIAEEHVAVSPEMVNVCGPESERPGWANAIDYANAVVRLTGAVQALEARIRELEAA